jgi:iron complex outermembrane recepter protein
VVTKMTSRTLKSILMATVAVGGFSLAGVASAQEAAKTDEKVTVTGSRIRQRDLTSNSPLQTFSGEDVRKIGPATTETFFNSLPQFAPNVSRNWNNPQGGGSANLELRDLGTNRGLVLVNGRRLVPGDSGGAVNITILPPLLLERTEIITGGASATYGSDAISGVVNFILRDKFEGVQVSAKYGISDRGDAEEDQIGAIIGGSFADGKGHAMMTLGYNSREKVGAAARRVSRNAQTTLATGVVPGPSPVTPEGTVIGIFQGGTTTALTPAQTAALQLALDNHFIGIGGAAGIAPVGGSNELGGGWLGFNANGSLFATGAGLTLAQQAANNVFNYQGGRTGFQNTAYGYNFQPDNLLLTPLERISAYASANYEVNETLEIYGNFLFSNYTSENNLAPSPVNFTGANSVNLNVAPLAQIPTALVTVLNNAGFVHDPTNTLANRYPSLSLARRWNELGPRARFVDNQAFQVTVGAKGDFNFIDGADKWSYDAWVSHGEYSEEQFHRGYPSISRALGAGRNCTNSPPPGPGPCTFANLFVEGGIGPAAILYTEAPYFDNYDIEQTNALVSVTGDLFELPYGWLSVAGGLEYRTQTFLNVPDAALQAGDVGGANRKGPLGGSFDVYEAFGEAKVPLVENEFLMKYLGVEAGYRVSDYNTGAGVTQSSRFGYEYAPFEFLRFRGSIQSAVRAPSVGELFQTQAEGFPGIPGVGLDPCSINSPQRLGADGVVGGVGANADGANAAQVAALCAVQAPAVNFAGFTSPSAGQYRSFSGGNPNLTTERAETETWGVVIRGTEEWGGLLDGLAITVDYWRIDLDSAISSVAVGTSLSRCFNPTFNPGFSNASPFCQAIVRDPTNGLLTSASTGFISATNANLAKVQTDGIDVNVRWRFDINEFVGGEENLGTLLVDGSGTYLKNYETTSLPGDQSAESTGFIGAGTGGTAQPRWKSALGATWAMGDLAIGWRWTHVSGMQAISWTPTNNNVQETQPYNQHFLNAAYQLTPEFQLSISVDNVLDEDPQVYTGGFQYNTDPSTYDVIGRYYSIGVTYKE